MFKILVFKVMDKLWQLHTWMTKHGILTLIQVTRLVTWEENRLIQPNIGYFVKQQIQATKFHEYLYERYLKMNLNNHSSKL